MKNVGVNSVIGLVFLIFSAIWYSLTMSLGAKSGFTAYGPDFFPKLVITCMIVVSVLLILTDLANKNKTTTFAIKGKAAVRVVLILVLAALYIFILPLAGYIIATIVALVLLMLLFGVKKRLALVLTAVLFPIGIYYLFEVVLKVILP